MVRYGYPAGPAMTGITVDPSALQSAAPVYSDQAQALADIYDTLTGKLHAEGACWGNDDAGRAFAGNYVWPAITALEQLREASDGLATIAEGVYSWARSYIDADEAAKDDLTVQLGY